VLQSWRWLKVALFVLAVVTSLVAGTKPALAAEDAAVKEIVQGVMQEEYAAPNFGEARRKLQAGLERCIRKGCSGATKAEVYVALGMVASQLGQAEEAKTNFKNALTANPSATLPASGTTPNIKAQWAEVANANKPKEEEPAQEQPEEPSTPSKIPGWTSPEAFKFASEALAADQAGKLDECIEKNKQSLKLEEQPRTRLHLASCENRAGKVIDALRDAQKALEIGIQKRDQAVMKVARQRVKELIDRIPHVTFIAPAGVPDLEVTFDDRPVPNDALSKKFSIDPGKHVVKATGTINGFPSNYEETIDVKDKELYTVRITLKPPASGVITPGQIKCMLEAKTQEDVQKCLPQNRKNIVIKMGTDVSAYSDTNRVYVLSPAINASVNSPTSGWNVGGSYLLDFVSAASPDIVSMASPPFRETRHAGSLTGGYKPGLYGAQVTGSVSREPDYLSMTGDIAITADLNDKLLTPRLEYAYTHDRIGRKNTPYDVFEHNLDSHEFEAGATIVMSATSVLQLGLSAKFERGDGSKPYRYVPMFDPVSVAPFVPSGASIDLVNRYRLAVRPLEQLPTERDRYAATGRFIHRFTNATLRTEARLYYDSWSVKAVTVDGRYMVDLSRHLRVWPHVRAHAQTGANFYQRAYSAYTDVNTGQLILPTYRTGNRELAPMLQFTAGGAARIGLGEPEGDTKYGITISGDVMYSRFINTLFVTTRTAVYGTVAFDVEF
jgi:hypothetical protein